MTGRPSLYSDELAARILERLAEGESLRSICRDDDMPGEATVRRWALDDAGGAAPGFSAQYARARELGAHALADQLLEIADDGTRDTTRNAQGAEVPDHEWLARSRLRVDARKWLLARMLPKVYGDKLQAEHSGAGGGPLVVEILRLGDDPAS